jgi:N-acetylmuramic acid 6-phosphate etherase
MSNSGAGTHASLDELVTEARNPDSSDLDLRTTPELVGLMSAEDSSVPAAVAQASAAIATAIDAVAGRLSAGGRLIYVGAGTSGRLAALDAAESESTFSTSPGQVVALLAGGLHSSPTEQEAAEDDAEAGVHEMQALHVTPVDAVVGVSASGRTPYVLGGIDAARAVGALTVAVVSVEGSQIGRSAEHEIAVVVGPEILAGSTRLKAGTAQKLVLNMLSTIAMIRLGKTFGNLMVDVYATNEKLHARVRRVVREATGADPAQVEEALAASGGDAKVAIVSLLGHVDVETAKLRLAAADGVIRAALEA